MRAEITQDASGRRLLRTRPSAGKLTVLAMSLAVTLLGVADLGWVAVRLMRGTVCDAKVVSVLATAPGQAAQEYHAGAAATQSNATAFTYFVACATHADAGQRLELNVGNKGTPAYQVGDTVRIAHGAPGETLAIAVRDFRTWSVGVFVTSLGLIYFVVIASILWRGRRPVEVPDGETL
ncbi:hypothetical protein [Nibricoccus sp. IMCC34717]|uniref:hypothetical protein n=1 Tax=Nibricoccus sp. IMCC34717 TaxID=3034021 RepID=UPI00384B7B9A